MYINSIRLVNSIFVAVFAAIFQFFLPNLDRIGPSTLICGMVCFVSLYYLCYLLEPYVISRLYRRLPVWNSLPFDLLLLQYLFGKELNQVVIVPEKDTQTPCFGSGSEISGNRIYLSERLKEELNLHQMKGLFGATLSQLSLKHSLVLWLTGAAGLLIIFFSFFIVSQSISESLPISVFLSQATLTIYLVNLLVTFTSRRLIFIADRYSVKLMSYREYLVDFLEYLDVKEKEEAKEDQKSNASLFLGNHIPPASRRLEKILQA